MEEAVELIAARAAKGPVKKPQGRRKKAAESRKSAKGNKEAVEETAG